MKDTLTMIADLYYQGNYDEGTAKLGEVLPQLLEYASGLKEEQRQALLDKALQPMLQAMNNKDCTLLADLITYELMESL